MAKNSSDRFWKVVAFAKKEVTIETLRMAILKMIYYGLLVLCLLSLLLNYRNLERRHHIFIPIIIFAILVQVVAEILSSKHISHYFLFHIYIPFEYCFLSIYYSYLLNSKPFKILLLASNIALIIFCIFKYYTTENFFQQDYSHFVLESVFVTFFVILFFYKLFKSEERINLMRFPDFWINTGNLLFYAGCLFIMGLYLSLRQKNKQSAEELLLINHYLNLALYFFYIIGFTCSRTRK